METVTKPQKGYEQTGNTVTQSIAPVIICGSSRTGQPVHVIGNYCMDACLYGSEDNIFPLRTGYGTPIEYAAIAQEVERVLGKDEVSDKYPIHALLLRLLNLI